MSKKIINVCCLSTKCQIYAKNGFNLWPERIHLSDSGTSIYKF